MTEEHNDDGIYDGWFMSIRWSVGNATIRVHIWPGKVLTKKNKKRRERERNSVEEGMSSES